MEDHNEFEGLFDAELPQEKMQADILHAFSEDDKLKDVAEMLEEYKDLYGKDIFWKLSSFDLAEVHKDTATMHSIVEDLDSDEVGPVMLAILQSRIYFLTEDYSLAWEILNQIQGLEDTEEALMFLHLKGICAFALEDYKAAVSSLEDVLMDFDDFQMRSYCALAYLQLQKNERAEEYLEIIDQQAEEEDLRWLVEMMSHFGQLPLIDQEGFPEHLRQRLLAFLPEQLPDKEDVEELVRNNPEVVAGALGEMLQERPEDHPTNYFYGLAMEELGKEKMARKHYRKALLARFAADLDPSEQLLAMEVRLAALDRLSYSRQVVIKYLRQLNEEVPLFTSSLVLLLGYCAKEELWDIINEIFEEHGYPEDAQGDDLLKLENIYIAHLMNQDDYESAYQIASAVYHRHIGDLYYLIHVSQLVAVFDPGFEPEFKRIEQADTFDAYLFDWLLAMESRRILGDMKKFSSYANKLYKVFQSEFEQSDVPLHDWKNMILYFHFVQDTLRTIPDCLPIWKDVERQWE